MKASIVPKDSALKLWLRSLSITEVPVGYQVMTGLSLLGALLRRQVYVNQRKWKVFPNTSLLLVGPSGIGKDVAINEALDVIEELAPDLLVGGKTIEAIKSQMAELGEVAACVIPASEITAFLGKRDYQSNIVPELTDLLSTGKAVNASTKHEGPVIITNPTVTLLAGSTPEWLANLPDGSLEGGFLPRLVIVCEEYANRHVAWVGLDHSYEEVSAAEAAGHEFRLVAKEIQQQFSGRPHSMGPDHAAEEFYRNWYCNRFKYFSKVVRPYANRSRDHIHRLAMLMAISRGHSYLQEIDYKFAATVIGCVADGLDRVLMPMIQQSRTPKRR